MLKKSFLLLICTFLSLNLLACKNAENYTKNNIDLKDRFYWAPCEKESSPEEAERILFHKFSTSGKNNIRKVAGSEQEYVWLRLVFYLPEELQNKSLALFISYLHFSDKVWVNGIYIGGYGEFPPNEKSSLWASHLYTIPSSLILQNERNTVLIKVYCKGRSGISDKILLGEYDKIKEIHALRTFLQSTVYVFAEGVMFFTGLLFFVIFIWRKKEKEYFSFSLLCFASMMLATPFFATLLPITYPNNIPYLFFIKITLCEGIYLIVYFLSRLILEFLKIEISNFFKIERLAILIISSLLTFFAPTYDFLMQICHFMLALSLISLISTFIIIAFKEKTQSEKKDFIIISSAFIPLIISIPIDFVIKGALQKVDHPYITLLGWLLTILDFIVLLSIRYNRAISQNEYLNIKLRREVLKQTRELSKKNIKLEEEIKRAETDLEMASLVQKKFFPYPPRTLRGWDIAVSYSPLDKVSGDMFDYYIQDNILNGCSLFDVSGHGVAASLVTMLAKNIVFQAFMRNMENNESISRTLYEINDEIIEAKGEIENYLTGLMFRFGSFNQNDECLVEVANAGHPNPILYSAKSNICDEIESSPNEDHHGAIGLDFITVSFPQINFTMAEDDILLFYTDGLIESRNQNDEMFGKERVKKILKKNFAKDAQSIMEDIIDEYHAFTKGVKRDDDITVVVMKRENPANFIEELLEV